MITNKFYPSIGSTDFQERNLTVNFSKAYERTYSSDNVISWFEFQWIDKYDGEKNKHFDCLIINITKKEIFLIEAKRYTNTTVKNTSIKKDIERINRFIECYLGEDERLISYKNFNIYGLIKMKSQFLWYRQKIIKN